LIDKAEVSLSEIQGAGIKVVATILEIEGFIKYARRQMGQILRRVVEGEV